MRRSSRPALVAGLAVLLVVFAVGGLLSDLVRNTALLVLGTWAISLPLGTALACLLVRTDLPGRREILLALAVLLFVPLYLQSAGWQAGFGLQGWYTALVPGPAWIDGWRGAVWIHGLAATPWVVLIVGGGVRFVEPELEELALLDLPAADVFRLVTLRRAAGAAGVAALWVGVLTAGEMTVTSFFQIRTYAEVLYTQLAVGLDPNETAARALPGALLTASLVLAALVACARLAPAMLAAGGRPPMVFRLGRWRWPLATAVALVLLIMLGVPLANLMYKAGVVVSATPAGLERSWSAAKGLEVVAVSPLRYAREFRWSLVLALLSASGAVVLALGPAWTARRGGPQGFAVLVLAAFTLALPGPVIGLGVIALLNHPELPGLAFLYDQTLAAPWLALVVRSLPLALLILWYALRSVPPELLEAAALEGAGPVARLLGVALPLRWPAVAAAWLVALVIALGDLAASILVLPPGMMTLSVQVFLKLHYGQEDDVAGICLALAGLFAGIVAVLIVLVRKMGRRSEQIA